MSSAWFDHTNCASLFGRHQILSNIRISYATSSKTVKVRICLKELLKMRYEKILIPTLQKIMHREKEQIDLYTKDFTTENLKEASTKILDVIRKADNYALHELKFVSGNKELLFRKTGNKLAIIYDHDHNVSGIAPIRKDYQEVKAFIYEMGHALNVQLCPHTQEKEFTEVSSHSENKGISTCAYGDRLYNIRDEEECER